MCPHRKTVRGDGTADAGSGGVGKRKAHKRKGTSKGSGVEKGTAKSRAGKEVTGMNYGGEAADQVVRYSLDGLDHGLRLSGAMAKNLAIFIAAVLKDQKKSYGKTRMMRMLKENRPLKFFTVSGEKMREFNREAKRHGLLYVGIRDRKNPEHCEIMVFADDAAKVNRIMDRMGLDYLKSESGQAVHKDAEENEAVVSGRTETVEMPEGEVRFEISDFEEDFNFGDTDAGQENFTKAKEAEEKNPSKPSSHSSGISIRQGEGTEKPSVREELKEIRREKEAQRAAKKDQGQISHQKKQKQQKHKKNVMQK